MVVSIKFSDGYVRRFKVDRYEIDDYRMTFYMDESIIGMINLNDAIYWFVDE